MAGADSGLSNVERLVAIEEIRQLKARYFRALDTKDWDLLADCFADDAIVDFSAAGSDELRAQSGLTEPVRAKDAVEGLKRALSSAVTVHQGYMPEIELQSATTATAIWAMADRLWYGDPADAPYREIDAVGYTHEKYERVADRWLIKSLRPTRLRLIELSW